MISPPTDNLYKFCAISGLITILFSLYYPATKLQEQGVETQMVKTEVAILEIDKTFLINDLELSGLNVEEPMNVQLKEVTPEILNKIKEFKKNIETISGKINILEIKSRWMWVYSLIMIFAEFFGITLALYGFKNWHEIQKKLDKK